MLTGKYNPGQRPTQGRIVEDPMYASRYREEAYLSIAERFTAHARESGVNPATLAVAWAMAHPAVTAPIIGARSVAQLEASLQASEFALSDEWRDEVSGLSYQPSPATDRNETVAKP